MMRFSSLTNQIAKRFFGSIRTRLTLLILLAEIPVFWLTLNSNIEARNHAVGDARTNTMLLASHVSAQFEDIIDDSLQLLITLAEIPQVRNHDSATCNPLLANILKQYPAYSNIAVIVPDGTLVCSAMPTNGATNIGNLKHIQRALQTRKFAMSDFQVGPLTQKSTIAFGYPILNNSGEVEEILGAGIDLIQASQLIDTAQLGDHYTLTVIDGNGTIIIRYPDSENWVGKPLGDAVLLNTILAQGNGTSRTIGQDGITRLVAFTGIDQSNNRAYAIVGIPEHIAFADANYALARDLLILVAVATAALVFAWGWGNLSIIRRVNQMLLAAQRIAHGDLSARTGMRYGVSELSQLSRTFDAMAVTLEQREAEHKKAEQTLKESEERYRDLFENANDLIQSITPDGKFLYTNTAWQHILGYTEDELTQLTFIDVIAPEMQDHCIEVFQRVVSGESINRIETVFISKNGNRIIVEGNISCRFENGTPISTRGIFRDVTTRKQMEEKLRYMSEHDGLTGLFNRAFFDAEIVRLQSSQQFPVTVFMIDVNDMKTTNDAIGHSAGDELLRQAAAILKSSFRSQDTVARFGGDEFTVLLPSTNSNIAQDIMLRMKHALASYNQATSHTPVSISIGFASASNSEELADALIQADKQMYIDKMARKNST